jgi:tubulin polyglutamylase TTLL6/13
LRIYVLLYGINPMKIYIFEDGLARFATTPYETPNQKNLNNMYMHLTNYAINKNSLNFV